MQKQSQVMQVLFFGLLALSSMTTARPSQQTLPTRQSPGKCTIGIERRGAFFPSPKGGNVPSFDASAYIVGPDGVQTSVGVTSHDTTISADGEYGGISGGKWHIDAELVNKPATVNDCTISLGDVSYTKSKNGDRCNTYSGGGPFKAKGGCRCTFDCT